MLTPRISPTLGRARAYVQRPRIKPEPRIYKPAHASRFSIRRVVFMKVGKSNLKKQRARRSMRRGGELTPATMIYREKPSPYLVDQVARRLSRIDVVAVKDHVTESIWKANKQKKKLPRKNCKPEPSAEQGKRKA